MKRFSIIVALKKTFLFSIYQTFQISPGTPIPWRENLKLAVRALLITPSYATGCKE
jgi:hypothetical protein